MTRKPQELLASDADIHISIFGDMVRIDICTGDPYVAQNLFEEIEYRVRKKLAITIVPE